MIHLRQIIMDNPLLKIQMRIMRVFGLAFFDDQKFRCVHKFRGLLAVSIWSEILITEIIDLIQVFGDLSKMTTNAACTLLVAVTMGQSYQFLYYGSDLLTLILNEVDSSMKKVDTSSGISEKHQWNIKKILSRNVRKANILTKLYWSTSFSAVTALCFATLWKYSRVVGLEAEERKDVYLLMIPVWYPVDVYENFIPIYIHQAISCYVGLIFPPLIQTMIIGFMIHASTMLEILKYRCATFTDGIEDIKIEDRDLILTRKLRDVIATQKELGRFIQNLDKLLSTSMFFTFVTFSILLCSLLFQLSSTEFSADSLFPMLYIFNINVILSMFYWHANEIAYQSSGLPNSIYLCDWYKCSTKLKNLLLIYMIGSQKSMTLSAGYFTMTLDTYINILKASYSYFTLLTGISSRG